MTTPRPDLVNLPQLTTPSEANTLIVVQDSAVAQYLTVPQARALLSLTVGYSGSRGQVGFVGSTGYTGSFGLTGYTGSTGTQGLTGYTGSTGTAATVAVGLVTISTSTASVTNVGTPYAAIFDFVLQRGPIGYTGSTGTQGLTGYTGSTGTQGDIGFTGSRGLSLTTATDLAGGAVGSIPIQVATSQTGFIPIGSDSQILQVSGGTAAWANTSTLQVGYARYSDNEFITQLTTSSGIRYPTMVVGAGGYASLGSTLDFSYNSATKNLTAGGMTLTNTTTATSTITGALTVAGGVGIGGDLYISGSLYVNFVGTATNLRNGTAGQVPYQTAPGVTSFYGPGTAGNVLVSNGTSAPSYNNTLTLAGTTTATSTFTGALVVAGGVGIGGSLYVGGEIIADKLTIQYTTVTTTLVQTDDIIRTYNSTNATSTSTGALQIVGGAGIGGDLWVGGTVYVLNATIGTAVNISGGSTGTVLFQDASSSTKFTNVGNDNDILVSRGVNALGPRFVSTGNIFVGYATTALNVASAGAALISNTATNLAGGTVNQIPYQTSTGVTSFFGPGTAGQLLISNGTIAGGPLFVNTNTFIVGYANTALNVANAGTAISASTATNLAGGTAGQVPYQVAPGQTNFYGPGTAGNVLVSNGTSAPSYNNTLTLAGTLASTATVASNALYVAGGVGIGQTLYVIGDVYSAGEITAYYSDDRLKNRLEDIPNALDKVKSLSGFYYTPNETALSFGYKDKRQVGVSAQATQKILPEIVTTAPVNADYLTVQYEKFIPLLIEAIKELSAEVEELKKKIQ
jgi:hypothetical protein